jgi:hypothetical protein
MKRKILISITTTSNSDWRRKIKEIDNLKIKEIAVFLTCLDKKERKEFYNLLEKTKIKSIPFVHMRSDMSPKELDYFIKKYNTKVFNIHSKREYPLKYKHLENRDKIYIENVYCLFDNNEIKSFGGICLDLTHFENDRIFNKERYFKILKVIKEFKIGCNHISVIKKTPRLDKYNNSKRCDSHFLENLSELDYLKKYPANYFSPFVAIELENTLKEQLEIKKYIEKILVNIDKK